MITPHRNVYQIRDEFGLQDITFEECNDDFKEEVLENQRIAGKSFTNEL